MDYRPSNEGENMTSTNEKNLLKKLKELKLLKEAMEKSKPSPIQCCHQRAKKKFAKPSEKQDDLHLPDVRQKTTRYMVLAETMEVSYKNKLQRKIEIMQRLLNEERKKKKEKLKTKENKKSFHKEKITKFLPEIDPFQRSSMPMDSKEKSLSSTKDEPAINLDFLTDQNALPEDGLDEPTPSEETTQTLEEPKTKKGKEEKDKKKNEDKKKGLKRKSDFIKEETATDSSAGTVETEEKPLPPQSLVNELLDNFQSCYEDDPKPVNELPLDTALSANPTEIIFQFSVDKPDLVYKKKLKITNTGCTNVYCGYENILVKSEMVNYQLTAKPKEILLLRPGFSLTIEVQFCPTRKQSEPIQGKVLFVTKREENRGQYTVPILCQPIEEEKGQERKETVIRFQKVMYWENPQIKTITLENPSAKECFLHFSRISDVKKGDAPKIVNKLLTHEIDQQISRNDKKNDEFKTIDSVIEEILSNTVEPISLFPQYCIKIPPLGKAVISVKFRPNIIATEDSITNKYEARMKLRSGKIIDIHKITVHAQTEDVPLKIMPPILDMQLCIEEGGVQQRSFQIFNNDRIPWNVSVKIPKVLKKFIFLSPNNLFIQNGQTSSVCIRIFLRRGFQTHFAFYLQDEINVIEFPIFIHPLPKKGMKLMPLLLPVIGVATVANGINISPSTIHFGAVNTTECAKAEIQIFNNSLIPQHFCFINLPKSVNIQPGSGYGRILPEESKQFDILYSPQFSQIACCGNSKKKYCFNLTCITALTASDISLSAKNDSTESLHTVMKQLTVSPSIQDSDYDLETKYLKTGKEYQFIQGRSITNKRQKRGTELRIRSEESGNKNSLETDDTNNTLPTSRLNILNKTNFTEEKLKIFGTDDPFRDEKNEDNRKSETYHYTTENSQVNVTELSSSIVQEDYEVSSLGKNWDVSSGRVAIIKCSVDIIDPYLEFSSQKILLPPTPCYSTSIATITLRERREETCDCGKTFKRKNFTGIFQLITDCAALIVQPRSGNISSGERINIFIAYNPTLKKKNILSKAKEIRQTRIDENAKEMQEQKMPSKSQKSQKSGQKTPKTQQSPSIEEDVTDEDIQLAKENILRYLEPRILNATVICRSELTLRLDQKNKETKNETHECHVVCQVVQPDFLIKLNDLFINFGNVPVHTRATISIPVENISSNNIYISTSHLDPVGGFSCHIRYVLNDDDYEQKYNGKYGKTNNCILLEPQHITDLRLHFRPKKIGQEWDRLEIKGGRTLVNLKITGRGTEPGINLIPSITLFSMEAKPGTTSSNNITITSTCEATQYFKIIRKFTKFIELKEIDEHDVKEKVTGKSKKQDPEISDNLKTYLEEKDGILRTGIKGCDAFLLCAENGDSNFTLLPQQKVVLNLKFSPPSAETSQSNSKEQSKKKTNDFRAENESNPTGYAAKFVLLLGGTIPLKEWFGIGKIK